MIGWLNLHAFEVRRTYSMGKKPYNLYRRPAAHTSWDPVAHWYNGWVGKEGSIHHRRLAIPVVLGLLDPQSGERILDIGAGQGVLAPFISKRHAIYTGVDISGRLLQFARKHHGRWGRFVSGDARRLSEVPELHPGEFDAVVFLLSIQNMDPLCEILQSASWALRAGGRAVLLMTHPCFRAPRQSGWGWDQKRKLQYRRMDRYLTSYYLPEKVYPRQKRGIVFSFHRPLEEYINTLADCGLVVDRVKEITTFKVRASGPRAKAENMANQEIPLFLGLRARKISV
jgi:SAM-dependent methyltransferase